jgi:2-deoxy-D-gluconate 3-dehydrogenase
MSLERFSLEGKVALVTGASRGIGRAIAIGFAEAGADVAVAARSEGDLETLAKEIDAAGRRALVVPTDVRSRDAIQAMVDRTVAELGGLDILVNNAGGSNFMSPLVALRPEGWDKLRTLNLDSVFHATQIGAQAMLASGGGSIIQIASVAGIQGAQGLSPYSASKGGVRFFSQAVAKELAGSNIRVNSIAPGWIDTPLNEWMTSDEGTLREAEKMIPMGRIGQADEIVGAAIYLASDASTFVTGTTLVIDGGQTA